MSALTKVDASKPRVRSTHEHPVYIEEGVLHYCVPNIPGAVARTATHAFVNCAMPYIMEIADGGVEGILKNPSIEAAVNTHDGKYKHLVRLTNHKEVEDGLD